MQNIIDTSASFLTIWQIPNISLDKLKLFPLLVRNERLDFVKVILMSSSEVIKPDHVLIELKKCF
nr:hypothetical protein L321_05110 [Pseudomonas plecoglossicida NB2011]